MPYLSYVKENRRLFKTVMENAAVLGTEHAYEKMFRHVFTPILERYKVPETDREYMMTFYINGLMAIITQWLRTDCADTIEHIISLMRRCVAHERQDN